MTRVSTVIPVYNEHESLPRLHEELNAVAEKEGYDLEIIFVDDGSTDKSWNVIQELCSKDVRVRGIRFRRNFGKASALHLGFKEVSGDIVFTLDGDLQDDPEEIPRFIEKLESENLDVISGWKKRRYDPWHKIYPSRVFNWIIRALLDVKLHDQNCGFKCFRKPVVKELRLYGELHRFVPVLAASRGWKVGEIVVNHRKREFGKSKYGVMRIIKGFLDLLTVYALTGFRQRPQHLLGAIGIFVFCVSLLGLGALTLWRLFSHVEGFGMEPIHLHEKAVFYYAFVGIIVGAQFLTIGVLAEMMTAYYGSEEDTYSIAERTNGGDNDIDHSQG